MSYEEYQRAVQELYRKTARMDEYEEKARKLRWHHDRSIPENHPQATREKPKEERAWKLLHEPDDWGEGTENTSMKIDELLYGRGDSRCRSS